MPLAGVEAESVGDRVAAHSQRIDDERDRARGAANLGIAALGELGRRGVDRAGDPLHGVAAEGEGLGVVTGLEEQDPGIRARACRRQADAAIAAERDGPEGSTVRSRTGVKAGADVENGHPGPSDSRVTRDREAASFEDIRAARPV